VEVLGLGDWLIQILDLNVPFLSEKLAIFGVSSRKNAVKHVHSPPHPLDQLFRFSHAHDVSSLVSRELKLMVGGQGPRVKC